MQSRDFCYWLQGFFELREANKCKEALSDASVKCIKQHLNLVFKHEIDPSMGDEKHQEELNKIHEGPNMADWIEKEKNLKPRC